MGAVVAALVARERHIVTAFERAGAVTPERARTLDDLGIDERIAWRRLRDHAIIRDAGDGRYYLDVEVWQANGRMRRRLVLVLFAVVLLAAFVPAIANFLR